MAAMSVFSHLGFEFNAVSDILKLRYSLLSGRLSVKTGFSAYSINVHPNPDKVA